MVVPSFPLPNGDRIPAIGLGTWQAEAGQIAAAVTEALKAGYRHIDCALAYGNEAEIGEALADAFDSGLVRREELWLTSKLWNDAHLPDQVMPALEKTLADLRVESLDLYLMHWPLALKADGDFPPRGCDFLTPEEAPFEATWAAMEELVDAGRCRHIGVSNFNANKIRQLLESARIRPAMNQVEGHPMLAQQALLDACRAEGILLTAFSPLGSPSRPERLRKEADPVVLEDPVVEKVALKHGISPAQALLAWAVTRGTCAIPKSVSAIRLRENLEAGSVVLDDEDMHQLASLDRGYRFIHGSLWAVEGSPYSLEWLWND